jgi:hypothetical protein
MKFLIQQEKNGSKPSKKYTINPSISLHENYKKFKSGVHKRFNINLKDLDDDVTYQDIYDDWTDFYNEWIKVERVTVPN